MPIEPFNVGVLPATPIQNYPQIDPEDAQHTANVFGQLVQNRQQQSQPNLVQQILQNRFQPESQDVTRSITDTAQSFLAPQLFKPTTPQEVMADRYKNELSPYTSMLELQGKMQGQTPSAVQEYQYYMGLPDALQQKYLEVKRAQQWLNLGDRQQNPATGETYIKGVPPQDDPTLRGEQARKSEQAKTDVVLANAAEVEARRAVGEARGKAQGMDARRAVNAPLTEDLLKQAEALLPSATSGGLETRGRDALAYFGNATKGSEADSQLEIISATLTANVPRMEGPQSDKDVALYHKAAGDLANTQLPVATRLAAIKTIRKLYAKYGTANAGIPAPPTPNQINQQMPSGGFDIDSYLREKGLQ